MSILIIELLVSLQLLFVLELGVGQTMKNEIAI